MLSTYFYKRETDGRVIHMRFEIKHEIRGRLRVRVAQGLSLIHI